MGKLSVRAAAALGIAAAVLCHTLFRLYFIDTATGFLVCAPPLKALYFALMAAAALLVLAKAYFAPLPDDPIAGGTVVSQMAVMGAGVVAVTLSGVMLAELFTLLPAPHVTLGSKISHVIGVPISCAGGCALLFTGYDYTSLTSRLKKACFALFGVAMQTYMLLYRFPKLSEVTTAPAQTAELFYLLSAALFMLFWARTLSGEATAPQNRLTYMAAGVTAVFGCAVILSEGAVRFVLAGFVFAPGPALLDLLAMAAVSAMALDFITGSFTVRPTVTPQA